MNDEISLRFTRHALERLFQREISPAECEFVFRNGKIIEKYPDDKPFPSELRIGHTGSRVLHVVVALEGHIAHVITAYEPTLAIWDKNLERRNK